MPNRILTLLPVLALTLASPILHAEPATIFKAPLSAIDGNKTKRYAFNAELGRAWVEVEIYHPFTETSTLHQVAVPGLSYDRDARRIVHASPDGTAICAEVREAGRWIFRHERIEPTGNCELKPRYTRQPVDTGFAVHEVEYFEVQFRTSNRIGALDTEDDRAG